MEECRGYFSSTYTVEKNDKIWPIYSEGLLFFSQTPSEYSSCLLSIHNCKQEPQVHYCKVQRVRQRE